MGENVPRLLEAALKAIGIARRNGEGATNAPLIVFENIAIA
jgi:hypothetical protein